MSPRLYRRGAPIAHGIRLRLPAQSSAAGRPVHTLPALPILAILALVAPLTLALLAGCGGSKRDPGTVTMLIESSPTSLDPRIGVDAQSEHIDSLIFDSLVHRDRNFNLSPWLATSWQTPDPLTYIFHLRHGVYFQNGKPLTAEDVKWTLDTMRNGTLLTAKGSALASIQAVSVPNPYTVVVHLKYPDAELLWNLSEGALGIVPTGSGRDFGFHPVGTGPFRFVSQEQDRDVVLVRNNHYWHTPLPSIGHIHFDVVPDAITRALELEKGSADVCINCLTADMVEALSKRRNLVVDSVPGTSISYIAFNTQDPILRHVQVRRAIAYAINRPLIIHSLWRDHARIANSLLPINHWAWTGNVENYPYDPAKSRELLDQAGLKPGPGGIRFTLTMKTSTNETSRLLGLILQQELRQVGIGLEVRSFEFATFYSDVTRGAFQMYTLHWVGGNEDPDIFRYAFSTAMFPPHGANRGRYSNPELDRLIAQAGASSDEALRRKDYIRVQQILASNLPSINLWYLDTILVHTRRLTNIQLSGSDNFEFLTTAKLMPDSPAS